ncbi:hypothetical protein [Mesorhizobium sp. M0220]|uniref:hypothetical protein n=1 Tax=Mesorhizobium sp. M0220 TaxID=2956920 RepID=UPI003338452B
MQDRGRERAYIRDPRSHGLSVTEGCWLMGPSRSTYYDRPEMTADDTAIVEAIAAICDDFEHYGCAVSEPLFGKRHDRQSQEDPPPDARA